MSKCTKKKCLPYGSLALAGGIGLVGIAGYLLAPKGKCKLQLPFSIDTNMSRPLFTTYKPKTRRTLKWILSILIFAIAAGIGAIVYWFYGRTASQDGDPENQEDDDAGTTDTRSKFKTTISATTASGMTATSNTRTATATASKSSKVAF